MTTSATTTNARRVAGTVQALVGLRIAQGEEFDYWRDVMAATFRDRAEFDVDYGRGTVIRVTIAAPGEFKLWRGSAPDVPPTRRDSLYLELAQPATQATFTTTWAAVP